MILHNLVISNKDLECILGFDQNRISSNGVVIQ